ncbi:MAG: universal stress protein [Acidimicrobiia bacterium]|nr:universal stress protein [Acidimicrobiia bacterium]
MRRILVGTDGSVPGGVAVGWAAHLARAVDAELIVASAWRPRQAEVSPGYYEELREEAAKLLDDDWAEPARAAGARHRCLLLEGDPRDLLLRAADDEDADLLVVGARGTGDHPHALHPGSVAHHVAHHVTRPYALVPAVTVPPSFERILVGVDGSEGSARAVDWCREVAPALGAEVLAVHAEESLAEWVPHDDPESWYQVAVQHTEEWSAPLREAGIPTRAIVVEHLPVTGLAEEATREDAGLVVVGTRGLGGFTGLRLGSTALKVLHHTGLPVVLVPGDET